MGVLDIWMNGIFVGQWYQKSRTSSRLVYGSSWVMHPQGRPLSLSLPMASAGNGYETLKKVLPDDIGYPPSQPHC